MLLLHIRWGINHRFSFKNKATLDWKLGWSRIFSPCLWADVPRGCAVLCDFCRTKLHSASGKEQVRNRNSLGESLQMYPPPGLSMLFIYLLVYLNPFPETLLGIVLLWHTSLIRAPKSPLLPIFGWVCWFLRTLVCTFFFVIRYLCN